MTKEETLKASDIIGTLNKLSRDLGGYVRLCASYDDPGFHEYVEGRIQPQAARIDSIVGELVQARGWVLRNPQAKGASSLSRNVQQLQTTASAMAMLCKSPLFINARGSAVKKTVDRIGVFSRQLESLLQSKL